MIAEPQNMRLDAATFRSGRFRPMSVSGVRMRSDTRFDLRQPTWRVVAARFQTRRMETRVADELSRQDLGRRELARGETVAAGATRGGAVRRSSRRAGEQTCL